MTFNLLGTVNLHQNQVGVRADAHASPGFVVVVVLGLHQFQRLLGIAVIQFQRLLFGHVVLFGIAPFQLNEPDDAIVHNADKLRADAFIHHRHSLDFDAAYAVGLDEYLVGDGRGTHDAPGCTVIVQFLGKEVTADADYMLKLLVSIFHCSL